MKTRHRCPQCQEWTDEKCYCHSCRDLIKKPPMARRSAIQPDRLSFRWQGKEC